MNVVELYSNNYNLLSSNLSGKSSLITFSDPVDEIDMVELIRRKNLLEESLNQLFRSDEEVQIIFSTEKSEVDLSIFFKKNIQPYETSIYKEVDEEGENFLFYRTFFKASFYQVNFLELLQSVITSDFPEYRDSNNFREINFFSVVSIDGRKMIEIADDRGYRMM
ncbi:hypothetical protein SAMN02745116_00329 [Pilibacter termitis]|uniref:Uncharacterized protein n=1 Tax=Pilibacter termitis TaxID=263852 RepID=A0A1T4KQB2_9ENTE|nr:hypothetical protein [Pilibacter termitis]SJZ44616.1 hypothetical protein SAMN02745116_00329 [Pilibacter termitis]